MGECFLSEGPFQPKPTPIPLNVSPHIHDLQGSWTNRVFTIYYSKWLMGWGVADEHRQSDR